MILPEEAFHDDNNNDTTTTSSATPTTTSTTTNLARKEEVTTTRSSTTPGFESPKVHNAAPPGLTESRRAVYPVVSASEEEDHGSEDRPLPPPQQLLRGCVPKWMMKNLPPPRSSSLWWWGVMCLGIGLFALRMYLLDMSGTPPRTIKDWDTKLKGHWGNTAAYIITLWSFINLPNVLVQTMLVRAACCNEAVVRGPDRQTWMAVGKIACVHVPLMTIGVAIGGKGGFLPAYVVSYMCRALYWLPREGARWLAEQAGGGEQQDHHRQRARKHTSLVLRMLLTGVPVIMLQISLDAVLGIMSAQQLTLFYPYGLSFVEYLIQNVVFTDSVLEGHSEDAVSYVARMLVAVIKGGRVGLLVVVYSTGADTFQGFVLASLNSALLEVLESMGFFAIMLEAFKTTLTTVQYSNGWHFVTRPQFRLRPVTLNRFERVYLGCRTDTEYWPLYVLVIMRLLDYGYLAVGNDTTTGELLPALRCGDDVLAVIGGSELFADACKYGARRAISRWCPRYRLSIVSVRPHASLRMAVATWLNLGYGTLHGMVGSGSLVEELEKRGGGD